MAINLTPIIDAVETALETEFSGTTLVFGVQAPTPANGSESVWVAVEFANYDYAATGIIYGLLTVNCFSHLGLSQATDLGDRAKDTLDGLTLAGVKADPATTPRQVTRAGSLYQVNTVVRFTVQGLTITAFSPTQGRIGGEIKIYGTGFSNATSAAINGVSITSFTVVSDGVIAGIIGDGTTTGKVSVTSSGESVQSLTDFVIGGSGGFTDSPIKTANFTTEAFYRYPLDSSAGGFIITLHSPADNDTVAFYDASESGSFTLNPVSITGDKLIYGYDDWILNKNFETLELIYKEEIDRWVSPNSQSPAFGGGGSGSGDLTSLQSQVNTLNNQVLGLQTTDTGLLADVSELQGQVADLEQTVGALGNFSGALKPLENVYVAPENDLDAWTNGTNAVTYAQYKANQAEPDPQDRWQTSDPNGANFRAFTLSEAAKYCNENISPDGLATLYLKAGIYYIDATFNCSVLINGCENNGTVGDYKTGTPNTLPANSVIFYQKFEAFTMIDSSDGQLKLRNGRIAGTLTIQGKATSTIKNCHFWSCLDWLEYQDKTIEDVFVDVLADPNVTDSWNGDSMAYALDNRDNKIVIENGSLITDSVVTMGACCPSGNGLPFKSGSFLVDNGSLDIRSLRLRGNGLWIYPVSVDSPTSPDPNARTVLLFDDTWDGWAKCDSTGNIAPVDPITQEPIDPDTLTYRCASGFAQSFISFRGDCELRLGGARYSISVLSGGFGTQEAGIDPNCIRFEKRWNSKFGNTDTNAFTNATVTPDVNWQGSDNLGVEGATVFYSDDKAPSIRYLINIDEADSRLRLQSYCWDKLYSVSNPGIRGVFGSVYTITACNNASIIYSKPQSATFVDKAFGVTLDRGRAGQLFNTIWVQRSNNGSSIPYDPATIEANLKILTTQFTQRFYLNNEACTDTGDKNGDLFSRFSIVNPIFTW